MYQYMLNLEFPRTPRAGEPKGVIYTKPWVVDLLLNLSDYVEESNLVDVLAVEPAAGDGAFLVPMARRLVASCRKQGRPLADSARSLLGYELDEASAEAARRSVMDALKADGVEALTAAELAAGWVRCGDYLLETPRLPPAGFVLGNPPYIRLEDIPEETASLYRDMYPTMRGRADLYVAFFEAALRQLAQGGVCAFICADRWMLNQYGAGLRRLVTAGFGVEAVVEMHNADAFDSDVSAYPAVTVIRRRPQGPAVVASAGPEAGRTDVGTLTRSLRAEATGKGLVSPPGLITAVVPTWFEGSDPWPCGSPRRLGLLRRLEDRFAPLESDAHHIKVGIGVATGRDEVFITKDAGLVEESRLLPLAMAADTQGGRLAWSGHYLVDPWDPDGLVKLAEYPRLRAYFEAHEESIRKRNTAQRNPHGWYRTIDRVAHSLTAKPKLYIPDIKNAFNPVLDRGETYPHHNLYFIQSDAWDLEVLGGILLSAVGQFFIECYGVRMRGGYLRFQAQYLRRIRVPGPSQVSAALSRRLVQAFRERDRDLATRAAAELYGIERRELEGDLGR